MVGSPRSGTSILTWSLGQHSNIFPVEESDWLAKFGVNLLTAHAFGSTRGARSQLSAMSVPRSEFLRAFGDAAYDLVLRKSWDRVNSRRRAARGAFHRIRSPSDPKRRWVDGTPGYAHHIVALQELFPRARFIHILRDVQSAVLSMVNFDRVGGRSWDWNQAYETWMSHVGACVAAERAFGSTIVLRIALRDLTADPETTLRRCLAFVGEDLEPACLTPLQTERINSSRVEDPEAQLARRDVDPELERRALELSEALLSEPAEAPPGAESEAAALRRDYYDRVAGFERLFAERGTDAFLRGFGANIEPSLPIARRRANQRRRS